MNAASSGLSDSAEEAFAAAVAAHPDRARESLQTFRAALSAGEVLFGDGPLPTALKPHFVPSNVEQRWVATMESLFAILERLTQDLLCDEGVFHALRLPEGSRELLSVDPGFRRSAVSCRPDVVWNGSGPRAQILEINADSPAMMTFTDRVEELAFELFPLDDMKASHCLRRTHRTKHLLNALIDCYRQWGGKTEAPTIAIVDWRGTVTRHEQQHTARVFTELGCPAFVCDPRELSLVDGRLHSQGSKGRAIDIVQRRVLFPDFLNRCDELGPLLKAYRSGKVCMVNPLRSYLFGSKSLLALFHQHLDALSLNPADRDLVRDVIPFTFVVASEHHERLRRDRTAWVLKAALGHGGEQVVLGNTCSESEWASAIERSRVAPWVAQELLTVPRYKLPLMTAEQESGELFVNWNPWIFGGRYAGATTRASTSPMVSITRGGALVPAIAVTDESCRA